MNSSFIELEEIKENFHCESKKILDKIESYVKSKNSFGNIEKIINEISNLYSIASFFDIEDVKSICNEYIVFLKNKNVKKNNEYLKSMFYNIKENIENVILKSKNNSESKLKLVERLLLIRNQIAEINYSLAEKLDREIEILKKGQENCEDKIEEIVILRAEGINFGIKLKEIAELVYGKDIYNLDIEKEKISEIIDINTNNINEKENIGVIFLDNQDFCVIFGELIIKTKAVIQKISEKFLNNSNNYIKIDEVAIIHEENMIPVLSVIKN